MINNVLKMIFGSRNERELKRLGKVVKKINALVDDTRALSDEQLQAKTGEFRQRLEAGETLDQLLPEAFAVVREAGAGWPDPWPEQVDRGLGTGSARSGLCA